MPAWIPAVALLLGTEPTLPVVVEGACEDRDALMQRVAVLVPAEAPLRSVRLQAARSDDVWQGTLVFEVDGTLHERALSAESCAALYEASALVIGLTLQPASVDDEVEVPGPPADDRVPSAVPATADPNASAMPMRTEAVEAAAPPATEPSALDPPRPRPHAQVQAGAGVAVGVLHPVHPLVTAGAAITGLRWAAGLDLLYLPPLAAELAAQTRAIVQAGAVQVRGCPVWRFADARLALPICAGAVGGVAWGRGEGEAIEGRRGREGWVSLLTGPRLELHARWGGVLWLAAELVVPLRRLNFVIGQGGPACCEAPVGAMLSLGGGWSLGRQRN
jgi:hypothetical protein